jgi:hypothetical protein
MYSKYIFIYINYRDDSDEDGEIVETPSTMTDLRDSIKGKSPTNFLKNPHSSFQDATPQLLVLEQPSPYINNGPNRNILPPGSGSRGRDWDRDRDIRGERDWADPRGGPSSHLNNRPSPRGPHQGDRDIRDRDWDLNNRNRGVSSGDRGDWDRHPPIRSNVDMDRENRDLHFRDNRDPGSTRAGNVLISPRDRGIPPHSIRSDMDRDRGIPPPMFPYDRDIRDQRDNRGNFGPSGFDSRNGGGSNQFQQHGPPNSFDSRGGPPFRGNAPPSRDQWDRDRDIREHRDLRDRDQRDRERLDQRDRNFDSRGGPPFNNVIPGPQIRRQFSEEEGVDRNRFISSPKRGDFREFRDNNMPTSRELPIRDIPPRDIPPRDMRELPVRDPPSKPRDNIPSREFSNQKELSSREEQSKTSNIINFNPSDNSSANVPIIPLIKIVSSQDKIKESASVFENIAKKTFATAPTSAPIRSNTNVSGGFTMSLVQPDAFTSTIDLSPSVDTMDRILGAVDGSSSPIRNESDGSNGGSNSARRPRAAWGSGITPRSSSWGKGIIKPVVKVEPIVEELSSPVIEDKVVEIEVKLEENIKDDIKEEKKIIFEEESEKKLKETKPIIASPRSPKVISNKSIKEGKSSPSKKSKIELVVDSDAELDDDCDDNISNEKPKALLLPKSSSKSPRSESKSYRGMKSTKELNEIEKQEREEKSKVERKRKICELKNKKLNDEKEEENIDGNDNVNDDKEDVDDEKFIKQNLDNSPRKKSKESAFKKEKIEGKDDDENKKKDEIKNVVTKSPRGGYRGGSNKGKSGNVNNIATSDKNVNNNSLSTPLPLRTPKREYNKAIKISKNSDIIKVREKSRVVLSKVFNSDSDLLLAFNTVRVMVEMRQGAMLGQPVQLSNIVFNDSLPDGVGSVPFPLMSDITSTLELVEKHSNYLYEAMMDVNRKQYILETIQNCKDAELIKLEANDVIKEEELESVTNSNCDIKMEIKNNETIAMETDSTDFVNTIATSPTVDVSLINNVESITSSIQAPSDSDDVHATDDEKDKKDDSIDPSSYPTSNDTVISNINTTNGKYITDCSKVTGESIAVIKGASKETLQSIQQQNKLRIIEAHIFTSLLNGSCENFPNSKVTAKYDPINPSKNKFHKIKQNVIDVVNNSMRGGNGTNSTFNTLLDESRRVLETKENMAKIRHHVTAEARIRKLHRFKAWVELGNRHHWAQQRWTAHLEDIEHEEADKEDKEDKKSPRLRSVNDNSNINSSGSSSRASRNTSSSSFGALGGGDIIRSDYDQDRLLAQLVAKEAQAARIKKGTAPTVNMISPWYKFDSSTAPKPPIWPNELRDFKNSKGEILDNKYPSSKQYPSAVFGSVDFIDLTCSRLTTDGARQICSYLSLDNPCPPNCNCARIVDKKFRYEKLWTDMEKSIFVDKFLQFPKNFCKIASYLVNRVTKDCIKFYYDTKASIPYKALLREFDNRRRHIRYQWVQSTTAALSVGSRIYPIGEKDGSHEPLVELPVDDGTFHSYLNHPPFQPLALNIDPKQSISKQIKLDIDNPREATINQAQRRIHNRKILNENNSKMKDNFNEIPDSIKDYLVDSCVKPILNHITAPLQPNNSLILSPTSFTHSTPFSSLNTPSTMSTAKTNKMNSSFHNNHQDCEIKKSNSSNKIDKNKDNFNKNNVNKDSQLVNADGKSSVNKPKQVRKRRISSDKILSDKSLKPNLVDSNGNNDNTTNLKSDAITPTEASIDNTIISDSNINNVDSNSSDINDGSQIVSSKIEELVEENEVEDLEELTNTEVNVDNKIDNKSDVSNVTEEVNTTISVSNLNDEDKAVNMKTINEDLIEIVNEDLIETVNGDLIETVNEDLIESHVTSVSIDNNDNNSEIEAIETKIESATYNNNINEDEMIIDSINSNSDKILTVDKIAEDKEILITSKRSFDETILSTSVAESVNSSECSTKELEEVVVINSIELQKDLLNLPPEKKAKIEAIKKEEEIEKERN